jgi:hypothetical protein
MYITNSKRIKDTIVDNPAKKPVFERKPRHSIKSLETS